MNNTKLLFEDLKLCQAPLERAIFDGEKHVLRLEMDTEELDRAFITFEVVYGYRFQPKLLFDFKKVLINGKLIFSIIEIEESIWVKEITIAAMSHSDIIHKGLRHFVIPSEDGVWEILSVACDLDVKKRSGMELTEFDI